MRDIKFRVWEKPWKGGGLEGGERMCFSKDLAGFDVWITLDGKLSREIEGDVDNEFILMQFTGLSDKNGKDCYDSDLVEYADGIPREVSFVGGIFSVNMENKFSSFGMRALGHTDFEIIGNIYENPELIKIMNLDKHFEKY